MKDDQVYLLHIRDAIDLVLAYTRSGRAAFDADTMIQDAVFRNIEIIRRGRKEAIRGIPGGPSGRPVERHRQMRDKLVHQYFRVNRPLVWDVVQRDLPLLRAKVVTFIQGPEASNAAVPRPTPPPPASPPS